MIPDDANFILSKQSCIPRWFGPMEYGGAKWLCGYATSTGFLEYNFFKSTDDGWTWAIMDEANAPQFAGSIFAASLPTDMSAVYDGAGTWYIMTVVLSTGDVAVRTFSLDTGTWGEIFTTTTVGYVGGF